MSESLTDASYNRRTSSNYSGSDGIQTTSDDQSDDNARYMVIADRIMYSIVLFIRKQQSIDKPILNER